MNYRHIFSILGIITLVWATMLLGLVFIWKFIVPISYPSESYIMQFLIGFFKVGASGTLALIWLYLWNKLVQIYFWKTLKAGT
ncbi:MAG TPA: hypothetical protein ENG63_02110 [Candidatus Desulfofervidus auxilii]|uniref:Uncharacterized protein n=1 Tax=Desulfofervidus auxilii TaxID=1621989 RepID=A0A7C0U1J5_DESA2|nr:hypothetical protein [Candidatus Desulfofervidus auxilii]